MKLIKLAYFSDRNQLGDIHAKFQFFAELKKRGIEVDFLTSDGGTCNFNKKDVIDKNLKIIWLTSWHIKYARLFFIKLENSYDGLLVSSVKAKENSKRDRIITIFKKAKKDVIQIFDSHCFDHQVNEKSDKFLCPSKSMARHFIPKGRTRDTYISGTFISPSNNPSTLKSKNEFYKKYDIPSSMKLIAVYPTRTDRLTRKEEVDQKTMEFYKNLEFINHLFKKKGFELVLKLHRFEYYGRKTTLNDYKEKGFPNEMIEKGMNAREYFWPTIKCIDDDDFAELINYSESSICICTSLIYFHHLFKKPTFYIAKNIDEFMPKQILFKNKKSSNKMLRDLIFGYNLKPYINDLSKLTDIVIEKTEKTEFNNFIKKNNNNHLITGVIEQDNLSKNANFIKKFYCKSLQLKS